MPAFRVQRIVTTMYEWTIEAENDRAAFEQSVGLEIEAAQQMVVVDSTTRTTALPEIDERVR